MFLEDTFIYFLAAITTVVVIIVGVNRLGLPVKVLREAFHDVVQCIGAGLLFFAFNVLAGVVLVFLIRSVWRFFPIYALADVALVVLSGFQGFVFHLWWRRSRDKAF